MAGCDDYSDSSLRSDISDDESNNNMYCVMHIRDVRGKIKLLEDKHLERFLECAAVWKTLPDTRECLVAEKADSVQLGPPPDEADDGVAIKEQNIVDGPSSISTNDSVVVGNEESMKTQLNSNKRKVAGFHPSCYRGFCSISSIEKKVNCLKRREVSNPELDSALSPLLAKKRQPTKMQKLQQTRGACVICKVKCSKVLTQKRRKQVDRLVTCETLGSEVLVEAAILKQDKPLLKTLGGGNLSDITNAMCHESCYVAYVRVLRQTKITTKSVLQQPPFSTTAYLSFCRKYIEEQIIKNKNILRLSQLNKSFIKEVAEIEGTDAHTHTCQQLKEKLTLSYPVLRFSHPTKVFRSEFVFIETVSMQQVISGETKIIDVATEQSLPKDSNLESGTDSNSSNLQLLDPFPDKCVLCRKMSFITERQTRKRVREKLMTSTEIGIENAIKVANIIKDNLLLQTLRYREDTGVETKYHTSCYRYYTRILVKRRKCRERNDELYELSYASFCKRFIEGRIIQKKEIFTLSELNQTFIKEVHNVEGKDASTYTTRQLKSRLSSSYPALFFLVQPCTKLLDLEFVFTEYLSLEELVRENEIREEKLNISTDAKLNNLGAEIKETNFDTVVDTAVAQSSPKIDKLSTTKKAKISKDKNRQTADVVLYTAALSLKESMDVLQTGDESHCDNDAVLFDGEKVPAKLFNFLAWSTGLSKELPDKGSVELPDHFKVSVFSLAQDIMYLNSRSKLQSSNQASDL